MPFKSEAQLRKLFADASESGEFKPYSVEAWLRPTRVSKMAAEETAPGLPRHHFAKLFGLTAIPVPWLAALKNETWPAAKDWIDHKTLPDRFPKRTVHMKPGVLKRVGISGAKGLAPAVLASLASGALLDLYLKKKMSPSPE